MEKRRKRHRCYVPKTNTVQGLATMNNLINNLLNRNLLATALRDGSLEREGQMLKCPRVEKDR